jgi:hypothetical protein
LNTPAAKGSGLKYRKEVIYVGTFFAPTPDGDRRKFDVTPSDLEHWKKSVELQLERGILVDVPIGHTTDPEKSRGKVIGAVVEKNSRDLPALFFDIEFADEEAAKLATRTQVSIYSPPSWTDGLGNTYSRPIRHVALTQQPVIPGLDAFTLVASLDEGTNSMEFLTQIAEALGLEVDPEMDEAALTQAILDAITSEDDPDMEEDPLVEDENQDLPPDEDTGLSLSMRREVAGGRKARVALLLAQKRITPAQAKQLELKYCAPSATMLSLSDDFDSSLELLALSEPRHTGSRTGAQINQGSVSPLVADAEKRKNRS